MRLHITVFGTVHRQSGARRGSRPSSRAVRPVSCDRRPNSASRWLDTSCCSGVRIIDGSVGKAQADTLDSFAHARQ